MLATFLKKYNHRRKEKFFQSPLFHTRKKYAFIGLGMHSLTQFYPLLRFFNIGLSVICTKSSDWEKAMSPLFPGCVFTHDLDDILNDPELSGVFVCATPGDHYSILARLLQSGKAVFIEKPPCSTLGQLEELIRIGQGRICKLGLQRRYWPGNRYVLKKGNKAHSYIYSFQTGPYPQGDPFTELFIHPLDYARFLYGAYKVLSQVSHKDDKGITVQAHLAHDSGVSGLVQCSTHGSWHPASEHMTVQTAEGSLRVRYPGSVTGRLTPQRFLNIPLERLSGQPAIIKEYYTGGPSLIPALEMNTLISQGFYHEIEAFVSLVEGNEKAKTISPNDLESLRVVYQAIAQFTASL